MKELLPLLWHFGGLVAACTGAYLMAGWPAILLVCGVWAMLATTFDMLFRANRRLT